MRLGLYNWIIDDPDSKQSKFDGQFLVQFKFQQQDCIDDHDFDLFLIKFIQFGFNLINFRLKDWKSQLKYLKSQLKNRKSQNSTTSD